MFLTVCLNPTLQKTLCFPSITPDAVNRTAVHRLDASGKGINVTRVLTQLGKKAVHLTQLGGVGIHAGLRPLFLSLCEQDGLSVEWVESGCATGDCMTDGHTGQIRFCYTLLTGGNGGVTELVEESAPVAAGTEERLLEKFDAMLGNPPCSVFPPPPVHCLIVSGTKAAGFSGAVIPSMVRKAKEKGLPVVLDIKGNDLTESLKYEPDIVKPNLFEFAATFAPNLIRDNDLMLDENRIEKQIKTVLMETCLKYRCRIILTNGSRKIFAANGADNDVENGGRYFKIEVPAVKAVNTTGCGDAFTAGLAAALFPEEKNKAATDFTAAISEGMRCGALNAGLEKPGVIR